MSDPFVALPSQQSTDPFRVQAELVPQVAINVDRHGTVTTAELAALSAVV